MDVRRCRTCELCHKPRRHAEPVGRGGRRRGAHARRVGAPRLRGRGRRAGQRDRDARRRSPARACCSTRHMDTVGVTDRAAWSADPAGELRDGRLYGRGSVDMKGPLAALVHGAAAATLRRGRVVVSASIAEEMVEGVATVEVARRVRPDVAVICEPSHRTVVVGQRGRAELIVDGRRAARRTPRGPDLGVNAVEAMADVLRAARELELPEHPALGPAILVVTDVISRPYPGALGAARPLHRHLRPAHAAGRERGRRAGAAARRGRRRGRHRTARPREVTIGLDRFDAYTGAAVEAPNFAPAWYTGADAPVARAALAAVGGEPGHWLFCTNGSGTAALGIPTIGFGPGDETLAHRVDEQIELDEPARGRARLRGAGGGADGVSGERLIANPLAGPLELGPPPAAPAAYHRSLPGYAPTPLVDARAAAEALGVARVLVKDESSRLGLPSFKILGASWAIHRALDGARATGRGSRARPTATTAAPSRGWRASTASRRPCSCRPHDRGAARGDRRRGRAGRGGGGNVRRGGRGCGGDRRAGDPGHGLAGLRGRAALGRRGLLDDRRRDRRRAGRRGGADRRRLVRGGDGAPLRGRPDHRRRAGRPRPARSPPSRPASSSRSRARTTP